MAAGPQRATVMQIAYAKTGSMLRTARVVGFILTWGQARRELGREITVEEYADYWGDSYATAYRAQALFREVFTSCRTPAPVLDAMEEAAEPLEQLDLSGLLV